MEEEEEERVRYRRYSMYACAYLEALLSLLLEALLGRHCLVHGL